MSRPAILSLLCALGVLAAASASHAATLEGQVVVRGGDGTETLENVTVHRQFQKPDGEIERTSTQADDSGRFRFPDDVVPGRHYLYADYRDISFPGQWVEVAEGADVVPAEVAVFPESSDGSRLQVTTARVIIAPDEAGAYQVLHRIYIVNPDPEVVRVPADGSPLLEIGLLPKHDPVQAAVLTPTDSNLTNVEVRDGVAEFRGPVFPDFSVVDVEYTVDAGGAALDTVLTFPQRLDGFRVLVPDDRLAVVAEGLYPTPRPRQSRPNAPPDPDADIARFAFQRYIGFDIAAGTQLRLSITPIQKVEGPGLGSAGALALLAGALLLFVGAPFVRDSAKLPVPVLAGAGDMPERTARDAYVEAVADLEHDFEMGKISAADRDRMHEELRREAIGAIAAGRVDHVAGGTPRRARRDGAAERTIACACGSESPPDARFCSACGRKL